MIIGATGKSLRLYVLFDGRIQTLHYSSRASRKADAEFYTKAGFVVSTTGRF